jgi:ATP-binding cassette subfamily B protein
MNTELSKNLWSFIWHFLEPYKWVVTLYIYTSLLAGCWGPFNSMLTKYILDALSLPETANIPFLTWPAALLVLNFIVFDNITWRLNTYLNYKYQPVIKKQIIGETFGFILGASHKFFQNNLSGRISNQINALADNIELILHTISQNFFRGFSLLVISFVSMYYVNPMFFYILALWLIAFSAFSICMSKRLVSLSDNHTASESMISGEIVDCISNINNVRIFARRLYEVSRLEKALMITKGTFRKQEMFLLMLSTIQGTLIAAMLGFMTYFLIHLYAKNSITVGDFALVIGLSMEVAHITWYTMSQVDEFNQAVGKCKQSLSQLIVPQDVKDKENASDLLITKGQITFSNVKFHYKATDEALFQNKSVTIKAGQKVGLVGYSGSGKSTFVNLILRIYDVNDGHISIDGQNISEVTQESLRKQIAIIPQDPSLFNRSLMENIRYGRIEASDAEVIKAAKKSHAHDFIIKLQEGYNSLVGERGVKLSGGQRQRISIARAILKDAPILILDEATSQLDSITEGDIQESLQHLMLDKTTIVIAHRLSTLLRMDRILVFDKGKIVEDGVHSELLANNKLYKKLWYTQTGGFLPDKKIRQ